MRTDRTFVCTDCRVRSWPVRRCPACGDTRGLVDLEQRPGDITRGPRPRDPREERSMVMMTLGGGGALASLAAFAGGLWGAAEVGLFLSLPTFLGGIAMWPRGEKPVVPGELGYRVLESPIVRARAARKTQVGTVRARGTLRAPLSGRECVAWRLWAEGPRGAIDDAMGVPFALVIGGGEPDVDVDAGIASLDLAMPASEPAPLPEIDAALAAWLRARGVEDGRALLVREAVLLAGDPVEVTGTARHESSADGYRGTRTRDVLADLPGSPLIVRTPPSGQVDGTVSNA